MTFQRLSLWKLLTQRYRNRIDFLTQQTTTHGPYFQLPKLLQGYYILHHPEAIEHILLKNADNYLKYDPHYNRIRVLMGKGLLTNNQTEWSTHRKELKPFFSPKRFEGWGEKVVAHTQKHVQALNTGKPLDVLREMLLLSLNIAGDLLFEVSLDDVASSFVHDVAICNRYISNTLWIAPRWFPDPFTQRFYHAQKRAHAIIHSLMHMAPKHEDTLLPYIEACGHHEKTPEDRVQYCFDEVLTFLVTGHETLGSMLGWTWWCLSHHPNIVQQLKEEIQSVSQGTALLHDDLSKLPFLKAVLQESMRLYPPVWSSSRRSIEADTLAGHHLPAQSNILFSHAVLHRHPDYWEHPNDFKPERFLTRTQSQKFTYLPFGSGPRVCIGQHFAMMQAMLILGTILQEHTFVCDTQQKLHLECLITLKPRDGLKGRLI